MGNINRLISANTILIPVLIISIIVLTKESGFLLVENIKSTNVSGNIIPSIISAILYGSYNSIILIPILLSLQKQIESKKRIKYIAIFCSAILIILAMCILSLIWKIDIDISTIELPTVYIASGMGKFYQYVYGFIILTSIYTSAVSAGYGVLENQTGNMKKYKIMAIIICMLAPIISQLGFSNLVSKLYPIFGVLGSIQILILFKKKEKY